MAICQVCTKSKQYGHNVSHSHRVTKRVFNANIIIKRVFVDGKVKRIKICSKCLKRVRNFGKIKGKDTSILAKNVITLVDWKKATESKVPEKITKPIAAETEISIEELVGKNI